VAAATGAGGQPGLLGLPEPLGDDGAGHGRGDRVHGVLLFVSFTPRRRSALGDGVVT
jgi:hypothetical protein